MPHYDYAPTSGSCKRCRGRFEVEQRMSDAKLKRCPRCDKPVERLISAPAINAGKVNTSDKRVGELGFTKYVKSGDGSYERAAGTGGPKTFGVK
jgi:putative FmdB family regulatory protein